MTRQAFKGTSDEAISKKGKPAVRVLTTTIKREFFRLIVAKDKRIEYRAIKPYWTKRLSSYTTPFLLRLTNGMTHPIPEATIVVTSVRKNTKQRQYELHLGAIRGVRHCPDCEASRAFLLSIHRVAARSPPKPPP